ncbi:MAG TPA: O-antigen ligase family protein [Terriglobales bacterium]|nr:O-antigen ligase family protein [Terriglobales bacterium]
MPPAVATAVYGAFILAVLLFERDRKSRVSWALWIPILWLSINASRTVSQWLGSETVAYSPDQFADASPFDASIFFLLILAGLGVLIARRRRLLSFPRNNWPLLLFLAYCLVSVLWSDYSFVAFKRWIKAMGDLVMVLIVLTDLEPVAAIKRLLTRVGALLIPVSILLIKYYPSMGRAYGSWTGEVENTGVATQKNGLGCLCLIFGLGCFWYLLEAWRGGKRTRRAGAFFAHTAILVLALWLFKLASSATSFTCFLIGCFIMVITSWPRFARKPVLVHTVVAMILFVVVYALLINPEAGLTKTVGRDATLTGRTVIWNQVLAMTVNPMIGAGYESFWSPERAREIIRKANFIVINQAHNGYLQVYLDLGWVGVALISLVMVWGFRNVVRSLRRDPEAGKFKLAILVVAAIYNLTEHAFRELHPMWIMFLLAIVVVPKAVAQSKKRAVTLQALAPQAALSVEEL